MEKISRKDFISKAGYLAGFAITSSCFGGCKDEGVHVYTPDTNVDFTIDVTDSKYPALKFNSGYIFVDNVIVVKISNTEFIAASKLCSDENLAGIIYADGEYYCTEHDATFDNDGNGTTTYNDKGFRGILTYKTELTGNMLRVFS